MHNYNDTVSNSMAIQISVESNLWTGKKVTDIHAVCTAKICRNHSVKTQTQ